MSNKLKAGSMELEAAFIEWLREGIQNHRLLVNDSKAKIHTVDGTFFLVTPGIFQRYVTEHPEFAEIDNKTDDWWGCQRHFERLAIHRKRPNGQNIWTCTVQGPRKASLLNGYLIRETKIISSNPPTNNPFLSLNA